MKSKLQSLLDRYNKAKSKKDGDLLSYQIQGEITTILSSTIDSYREHLNDIVMTVGTLMQAERVSLMVRKGKFLEISASHGLPENALGRSSLLRVGSGIAGKVAESGEPIFTGDLTRDKNLKQDSIGGPGFKSNAFICLPLKHEDNVLGVINVSNPIHGSSFRKPEFNFLKKVADQIAIFLHKSMKFESIQRSPQKAVATLQSKDSGTHVEIKKIDQLPRPTVPAKTIPPPLPPRAKKKLMSG
ncbi:MAG: GAF domain-containing protein [Pseudomonadota bacterium]